MVSFGGACILLAAASGLAWLVTSRPDFKSLAAGVAIPLLSVVLAAVIMMARFFRGRKE